MSKIENVGKFIVANNDDKHNNDVCIACDIKNVIRCPLFEMLNNQ